MKQKTTGCVVIVFLILFGPMMITLMFGREIGLPASGDGATVGGQVSVDDGKHIDLQEYLIGVTAAQLPGDYGLEAVKAQMILNRTYYYHVLGEGKAVSEAELGLEYMSPAVRTARWKTEGLAQAEEVFSRAARETEGQVMTCQKALAVGMSHPISAGNTRSMEDQYPYLCSVESGWDSNAKDYLTVIEYSTETLLEKWREKWGAELSKEMLKIGLQILSRDEGGYVESMMVGTEIISGEEWADYLGLPSCAFTLQWPEENRLSIICFGRGHGYGMSRYGANCLAKEGKTALQILQYYFQNVTVENWKKHE